MLALPTLVEMLSIYMHNDNEEHAGSPYDHSPGYADGVELRRILFETDSRRFPHILSDWIKEEAKGDHGIFLTKTGLGLLLSPQQLHAMELGEAVPGKRLASIMAMHQPGQFFREREEGSTFQQLYKFQRRAGYFRDQKKSPPSVIELTDAEFQRYNLSALDKIAHDGTGSLPATPALTPQPDPDMSANILGYLQTLGKDRRQAPPSQEELLETLLKRYKKSPAETIAGVHQLLSAGPHAYATDDIEGWFAAASPAKEAPIAAKSLRFLREVRSETQEKIEGKSGFSKLVNHYEQGHVSISARNAVKLASSLGLSDAEAVSFFATVNPSVDKQWLERQVAAKNWETIASPAFDPVWLSSQPAEKRSALLLSAHLDRRSMSAPMLAEELHVNEETVPQWKIRGVPPHRLDGVSLALGLSEEEEQYFADINMQSRRARRVEFNKADLQALDDTWLQQHPLQEQAGLLLTAFSKRKALTMEKIGDAMQLSRNIVFAWHHGSVPDEHVDALAEVLSLTPQEKQRFTKINAESGKAMEAARIHARASGAFGLVLSGNSPDSEGPAFLLDYSLIEKQPADKQAGVMLKSFSIRAGIRHSALARELGVTGEALHLWESGEIPVPAYKAGTLAKLLKLSDREAEYFIAKISPDTSAPKDWLTHKIKAKQWDKMDFPAFDAEWIRTQPETQRAGLILKAGRLRSNLSQDQLADRIGSTRNAVNKWEHGVPIPANKLGEIIGHLHFSEPEANGFIRHIPDGEALKDSLFQYHIGITDSLAVSFPAFNDEWLKAQPAARQAGLLLRAHREHKGISQTDLAKTLGVGKSLVSSWEAGELPITATKLGSVLGALQLDMKQAKKFAILAHPELAEQAGEVWLMRKIAQKQWQQINLPALDPEWLGAQPDMQQAGLLLRAYRERSVMHQGTFAKAVSRDRSTISDTELAFRDMKENELQSFAAALNLTDEEKTRLANAVALSRTARSMENMRTQLGSVQFASTLKQLMPEQGKLER